ncbi:MAG TPA: NAD(P)H-hydrate dehydratase [Gemmatimonadaceae bacterium]|nr:NAD(P)H-hydrate dehydratase [Gemmatimonadaceae bacterium]
MPPSVRVVSARESAERDRAAIEKGTPSRVLMRRAGSAAAEEISRRYGEQLRDGAVVFTGPGNNGGDGWVVAGLLARSGIEVTVLEAVEAKSPDAMAEKSAAADVVKSVRETLSLGEFDRAPVVIDALLGTGAEGEPRGKIAVAISRINEMHSDGARVVALDLPSGLDATTGSHAVCVIADATLSFGGVKRGSLLARDCCGEIVVLDIGLDEASPAPERDVGDKAPRLPWLVDGAWVRADVPSIRYDAHKGTRKHLAIIGGGKGMPGSVVLATRAALRSGIGLVRALVAPESVGDILAAAPSALIAPWPSQPADTSAQISEWADAIVIGPGLGKSAQTRHLVENVLADSMLPVLLDADALNVFDGDLTALGRLLKGRPALITPHVAEFARLAKIDVKNVLENRFDVGAEMARNLGATVLLKGSPTVIFAPDGDRYVVARGTAALGTGGSGDLLAGIAGTMLAQTLDAPTSACCAAWVHGRAAEFCEYVRGTTLEDVLYALPRAWNEGEPPVNPPVLAELPAVAR